MGLTDKDRAAIESFEELSHKADRFLFGMIYFRWNLRRRCPVCWPSSQRGKNQRNGRNSSSWNAGPARREASSEEEAEEGQEKEVTVLVLPYTYPKEWLSGRASSPEIVMRRHGNGGSLAAMIGAMKPGDQLRKFNSPKKAWKKMAGRFGYAVVRDGEPISMVVLMLN